MTSSSSSHSAPQGTIAVSIDIDKELWANFSKYIDKKYGPRKKTKMVEKLIAKYMRKQGKKSKNNSTKKKEPQK